MINRVLFQLFRALRSGLRLHTRSGGYAADSIDRYALTQSALAAGLVVVLTTSTGRGEVVIDMPAPPLIAPTTERVDVSTTPAPQVGDVALWRYAEARSIPRYTYPRWGWPLPPARYVGHFPFGGGFRPWVFPFGYAHGNWPYHGGFPFIFHGGFHFGHRR